MKALVALLLASLLLLPGSGAAASPGHDALNNEIARIAKPVGGVVGVAAWRLDGRGPRITVHGDERFPLASSYKVAIAGALLARVDAGTLSLQRMLPVTRDQYVASEVIADRFIHPGVSLSVQNLLELMLTQSDNTATDVLMEVAGGPEAVTAWVRAQDVDDFRVDRDTAGVLRDFFSLPPGPFNAALAKAVQADPTLVGKSSHPNPAYDNDPRDTATPVGAAALLARIFSGHALSPDSTRVLIETMQRCRTCSDRIRGRMPAGTVVADKSGTAGGTVNDIGVITLPDGSLLVLAVLIKKSDVPFEDRERAIADIARAVRDFYLYSVVP